MEFDSIATFTPGQLRTLQMKRRGVDFADAVHDRFIRTMRRLGVTS
jgi:hypothetical protein